MDCGAGVDERQETMTDYAFELEDISKSWPFFELRHVTMRLEMGQMLGFIGPNGVGKSTTIRILLGLITPASGAVRVLGLTMPQDQVAIKKEVGFISADMQLYASASVAWHMSWVASVYPNWDSIYANRLLETFNLHPDQRVKDLSSGERMKLQHLLVLPRRPRLLVLDEPTTGLDPVARHEILGELSGIMQDESRSVLFSSHNTTDIERLCDQIVFIDRGRILSHQDRESYLDRWRRVIVDTTPGYSVPSLPGMVACKQTSHSAVITLDDYQETSLAPLFQSGATVRQIDVMTLEEIFVATVMANRAGRKA